MEGSTHEATSRGLETNRIEIGNQWLRLYKILPKEQKTKDQKVYEIFGGITPMGRIITPPAMPYRWRIDQNGIFWGTGRSVDDAEHGVVRISVGLLDMFDFGGKVETDALRAFNKDQGGGRTWNKVMNEEQGRGVTLFYSRLMRQILTIHWRNRKQGLVGAVRWELVKHSSCHRFH